MKYEVYVPITGYATVEVEADSEGEACDYAIAIVNIEDLVTWQAHKTVVEGGVFKGELDRIETIKVAEED